MPKIEIDGRIYEVSEGKNFLEASLSLGLNLPYFCWHPALGSVGACRQCAVKQYKNEKDTRGKIVMACMSPACEGGRISIEDPEAKAFRASVIEWLMVNHPHDCPVCDEGGECHLQDMTLMTGHTRRRYRFKKRTFRNQDLGPFVNHEMNRCIACYRCVRFYREYAGAHDLNVFATHDHVYFGRKESGVLESEFSGNLVEVCPTGVFTDQSLKRHYTRKWDLQSAPSICAHCSVGCNTLAGERYGSLRRIQNRYHRQLNGYFICDRGRYGYEFVNSDRRVHEVWFRGARTEPMARIEGARAVERLGKQLISPSEFSRTIGIGSPRASLEANFALKAWMGDERFYSGMSDGDANWIAGSIGILTQGPAPSGSIEDVEKSDAVLILGEDLTQTAPRLALAVRQLGKFPVWIAVPHGTRLDELAHSLYRAAPAEIARSGFAIAHALNSDFPAPRAPSQELSAFSKSVAEGLGKALRPVVISGAGLRSESILKAAANITRALAKQGKDVRVCLTGHEPNSYGLGLLGGKALSEAFHAVETGAAHTVLILENDLFRRAEFERVKSFLKKAKRIVLFDHTANALFPRADVIFPSTTFAESDGTFVNYEGRAQRYFRVFVPTEAGGATASQESWRWIRDLMVASGRSDALQWRSHDDLTGEWAKSFPRLQPAAACAPPQSFRREGNRIPRQSHRYSGRTASFSKPLEDLDSPLAFSMEGDERIPPSALITRYWVPGWNSVQALNRYQEEVGGPLRGGSTGKKLIRPALGVELGAFQEVPSLFVSEGDRRLAIPIYHLFGSDELSAISPGIAELAPRPYLALHPSDARRLGVFEGDWVEVSWAREHRLALPARIEKDLGFGLIGIPAGIPGLEGWDVELPRWCEVSRHRLAGAA